MRAPSIIVLALALGFAARAEEIEEESPSLSRGALDADVEGVVGFFDAPGGIVLGHTARPRTPVEDWGSVSVEYAVGEAPAIRTEDGRRFVLPAVEPWYLAACVQFLGATPRTDVLIDIDDRGEVRVARAFSRTPLAGVLRRADEAPLATIPVPPCATRRDQAKSILVDGDVSFAVEPGTDRIELRADVEVRNYKMHISSIPTVDLQRTFTWRFRDGPKGLKQMDPMPAGTDLRALRPRLEDVSTLAGWLGFLRWARERDPAGVARLRREVQRAAATASSQPSPKRSSGSR